MENKIYIGTNPDIPQAAQVICVEVPNADKFTTIYEGTGVLADDLFMPAIMRNIQKTQDVFLVVNPDDLEGHVYDSLTGDTP